MRAINPRVTKMLPPGVANALTVGASMIPKCHGRSGRPENCASHCPTLLM